MIQITLSNCRMNWVNLLLLLHGENKFYTIENDLIKLVVSSKGGRPYSVELKKYKTFQQTSRLFCLTVIQPSSDLPFTTRTSPFQPTSLYFQPGRYPGQRMPAVSSDSLTMRLLVADNKYIEYRYILEPGSYMVDFNMQLVGMKDIVTRDPHHSI